MELELVERHVVAGLLEETADVGDTVRVALPSAARVPGSNSSSLASAIA